MKRVPEGVFDRLSKLKTLRFIDNQQYNFLALVEV